LKVSGLLPYLEALRFHIVGFGCTTCIGNSGPLPEAVSQAITTGDLAVAAVISGNRNFEGRVHPLVKANYLASPPLVVAYALAGRVDIDLAHEPLGHDPNGQLVYLKDLWPTQDEISRAVSRSLNPAMFQGQYGNVFAGSEAWNAVPVAEGELYAWDHASTYIQEPPFFVDMPPQPAPLSEIRGARALAVMGDSITTDHISPAGDIAKSSPAGRFLIEHGVPPVEFNSYGARRGNHEVMMRGTFANVRLKNQLVAGVEGNVTTYLPTGEQMSIYDASMRYQAAGMPLVVLAGKEYGTGSSRDWAAKGVYLLGVKAVLAESYERIHRSNLVGMGVLPLQFRAGESWQSLGLTGREVYAIEGIGDDLRPGQELRVRATDESGRETAFTVIARIDTPVEVEYYRNGGILHTVLRQMMK
jgi:aconitate hydratase